MPPVGDLMRTISRSAVAALVAASLFSTVSLTGCKGHDVRISSGSGGGSVDKASFAKRDSTRALGPGDLRVTTTDSVVEVALIGDSLVAGLGASTRNKIKIATDTSAVQG